MSPNPFQFEAANKFSVEEMADYFIPEENLTRFLESQKNVFLLGDRGTGKTMALRYYSLPVQACLAQRNGQTISSCLESVGIYVPCRRTELGKTEPELLDPFLGRLHGEHLLVTAMVANLSEALLAIEGLVTPEEERRLFKDISRALQWSLDEELPVFEALAVAAKHESAMAQRALNRRTLNSHYENISTFSTAFQPLVEIVTRRVMALRNSHFSLMFDDAEDLSDYQNLTLNSWIAVRDTSRVSFKLATSAVDRRSLKTITGGGLLERHDFIRVDLEQDFQNSDAAYGKLARKIVNRRLERHDLKSQADTFFPMNPAMSEGLKEAGERARKDAEKRGLKDRQIRDYVHKMERAIYFRSRPAQANRPPYSGFDLLVHVSTGVIRYLLEPCFEMYVQTLSSLPEGEKPKFIEPTVQTACLQNLSKRRWEWVKHEFNGSLKGCTRQDAQHLYNLIDQLAVLFKKRLFHHKSEPRAISFSVSAWDTLGLERRAELEKVLRVGRRAQILFERLSTGKSDGRSDVYYTFDRVLWIDRGLDPVGQNARVSLEARYLWAAAFENRPLPFNALDKRIQPNEDGEQLEMFEEDRP